MYCKKCGAKLDKDACFCIRCGSKITERKIVSQQNDLEKNIEINENAVTNDRAIDSRTHDIQIKGKRIHRLLIFVILAIVIIVGIVGICLLRHNANEISIPKNPNDETMEVLSDKSETIFNDCAQELVVAFNTRNEGNTGLINITDAFNNSYAQLQAQQEVTSGKEKEILQKLLRTLFVIKMNNDLDVLEYDSNGNKLDKPIVPDELLQETEESIQGIIDTYYK